MGGITDAIEQLLAAAGLELSGWMAPAMVCLGFMALLPWIRSNHRSQRIRTLIRRISSEERTDREQLRTEVLAIAAGHPDNLVVLTEEAHRRGMHNLAQDALARLTQTGIKPHRLQRLRQTIDGRGPPHIEGERAAIENLNSQGMTQAARLRVQRALHLWPGDVGLLMQQRQIEE